MSKRNVTQSQKKMVAGKQYHKCKNEPGSNLEGLNNYKCPLWTNPDLATKGCFDESGYEVDHIVEHTVSHDDSDDNLQALCKSCHVVKTKYFARKYPKKANAKSTKVAKPPVTSKTDTCSDKIVALSKWTPPASLIIISDESSSEGETAMDRLIKFNKYADRHSVFRQYI